MKKNLSSLIVKFMSKPRTTLSKVYKLLPKRDYQFTDKNDIRDWGQSSHNSIYTVSKKKHFQFETFHQQKYVQCALCLAVPSTDAFIYSLNP